MSDNNAPSLPTPVDLVFESLALLAGTLEAARVLSREECAPFRSPEGLAKKNPSNH